MAQRRTVKTKIASKERRLFNRVQITENFLLIVPLGTPDFESDLTLVNTAAAQPLHLVMGDVVIKYDQAAFRLRAGISLTIPRRVNANASRTPCAVIRPRYWRAIALGDYPALANSTASDTKIRVPRKINRPLQTRVSAAKCLPISMRAISHIPFGLSLSQSLGVIKRLQDTLSDGNKVIALELAHDGD
jgi:hypothetical protein